MMKFCLRRRKESKDHRLNMARIILIQKQVWDHEERQQVLHEFLLMSYHVENQSQMQLSKQMPYMMMFLPHTLQLLLLRLQDCTIYIFLLHYQWLVRQLKKYVIQLKCFWMKPVDGVKLKKATRYFTNHSVDKLLFLSWQGIKIFIPIYTKVNTCI